MVHHNHQNEIITKIQKFEVQILQPDYNNLIKIVTKHDRIITHLISDKQCMYVCMYVSLWVTDKAYCFFPIWPFGGLLRTAIMQFTNMSVC